MEERQVDDVMNKMLHLLVEETKVENEFEIDFGPRLRIIEKAVLIQKIGNQLHCSIITIAKAQILFHKVQRLKNRKSNTLLLAVACLIMSIKLCHEDITSEEVVLKFYHMEQDLNAIPDTKKPDPSSEEIQNMKTNSINVIYNICTALAFRLKFNVAHMYVFKFLSQLQSLPGVNKTVIVSMSTSVTKLLSTYYLCEGCLDFDAFEIATACLQFAYLFYGIFASSTKYVMKKELDSVSNKDRMFDILDEMIIVSDVSTTLKPI